MVSSLGAALVAREAIGRGDRERFVVLSLRADGRLLGVDVTSVGSIDRVEVDVRSVFRSAVLLNAESLVVAHNHCGEEVRPSRYDRQVTKRLTAAAYVLGFEVADSLIVGPHADYYSFRDRGEMPWQRRSRRRRARP